MNYIDFIAKYNQITKDDEPLLAAIPWFAENPTVYITEKEIFLTNIPDDLEIFKKHKMIGIGPWNLGFSDPPYYMSDFNYWIFMADSGTMMGDIVYDENSKQILYGHRGYNFDNVELMALNMERFYDAIIQVKEFESKLFAIDAYSKGEVDKEFYIQKCTELSGGDKDVWIDIFK